MKRSKKNPNGSVNVRVPRDAYLLLLELQRDPRRFPARPPLSSVLRWCVEQAAKGKP